VLLLIPVCWFVMLGMAVMGTNRNKQRELVLRKDDPAGHSCFMEVIDDFSVTVWQTRMTGRLCFRLPISDFNSFYHPLRTATSPS